MAKQKEQYVTFLNSAGEEISNDPRWLAQKTLEQYGVERQKAPDFELAGPYDEITDGKELQALAKSRGIPIKGIRSATKIRELLEEWDDENPSEDSDDDNDESTGDDKSGDSDDSKE